ncbi:hypothetical protein EYF80_010290 [Liparis tanakae]|uniref:Uncharacterized protein n=1 Tax=Liparis tanakae TaxID=230148 RepID=A0A4Z2INP6_9TELE|nr:hypothetical protein EYF80_010290 [Liparis tanakae]
MKWRCERGSSVLHSHASPAGSEREALLGLLYGLHHAYGIVARSLQCLIPTHTRRPLASAWDEKHPCKLLVTQSHVQV